MSTDLSDTGIADDVLAVVLAESGASEPEVGNSLTSRFAALRPRLWLQEIFGESCPLFSPASHCVGAILATFCRSRCRRFLVLFRHAEVGPRFVWPSVVPLSDNRSLRQETLVRGGQLHCIPRFL